MAKETNTQLVIGPNASMSTSMAWTVLAGIALLSFGIAGLFAICGLWPILPFAGLEVGALAVALQVSLRRNRYQEVLSFEGERLRIERGRVGEVERETVEWPRGPTRVHLEPGANRHEATRLVLSNRGRRFEVARCLTDEGREQLAFRLRELIHPGFAVRPSRRPDDAPADYIY